MSGRFHPSPHSQVSQQCVWSTLYCFWIYVVADSGNVCFMNLVPVRYLLCQWAVLAQNGPCTWFIRPCTWCVFVFMFVSVCLHRESISKITFHFWSWKVAGSL